MSPVLNPDTMSKNGARGLRTNDAFPAVPVCLLAWCTRQSRCGHLRASATSVSLPWAGDNHK